MHGLQSQFLALEKYCLTFIKIVLKFASIQLTWRLFFQQHLNRSRYYLTPQTLEIDTEYLTPPQTSYEKSKSTV